MPQTHSKITLVEYDELLYKYDQACEAGNEVKMRSLYEQIIAFQKRWSL